VAAQMVAGTSLDGVCRKHAPAFERARRDLLHARATGNHEAIRAAHANLVAVRRAIRKHCVRDFLSIEPSFASIADAASNRVLIYITAEEETGFAIIVPPQGTGDRKPHEPILLELPSLTWRMVDDWSLERRDGEGDLIGGFLFPLERNAEALIRVWIRGSSNDRLYRERLRTPVRELADQLPEKMTTLRAALRRMVEIWDQASSSLLRGALEEQELARKLKRLLDSPVRDAMDEPTFGKELNRSLLIAELDLVLARLSESIAMPLRQQLDALGLTDYDQRLALIPCGRLGILPIHAAPVLDAHTGLLVPFQETCELTYQASARTLALARQQSVKLPVAGPIIAVGDPQPVSAEPLPGSRREAEAVARLAQEAGRSESKALVGTEASVKRLLEVLSAGEAESQSGFWVEMATHGYADPLDPRRCYLLLAGNERLTLADLQRGHLLQGVRCFAASGCVTGLGDPHIAPDELNSFAAGVLQAGAATAVATMWSVSDLATCLLMIRFFEEVLTHPEASPAKSLQEASRWLRQASAEDIMKAAQTFQIADATRASSGDTRDAARGVKEQSPLSWEEEEWDKGESSEPNEIVERAASNRASLKPFDEGGTEPQPTDTSLSSTGGYAPLAHPFFWASAVAYGV